MTYISYSQSSFNFYLARNTSSRGARNMVRVLENRFYYLDNFLAVVASVRAAIAICWMARSRLSSTVSKRCRWRRGALLVGW